jgi:hypothetical protein
LEYMYTIYCPGKTTVHKLSKACYAIWSVKPFISQGKMKMVYYDYFHSIMNCGIIFLENSPHSIEVFKIQNNMIRIITGFRGK